jgi:hypothetical protein
MPQTRIDSIAAELWMALDRSLQDHPCVDSGVDGIVIPKISSITIKPFTREDWKNYEDSEDSPIGIRVDAQATVTIHKLI